MHRILNHNDYAWFYIVGVAIGERSKAPEKDKEQREFHLWPPMSANFLDPDCKKNPQGTLDQGSSNLQWLLQKWLPWVILQWSLYKHQIIIIIVMNEWIKIYNIIKA